MFYQQNFNYTNTTIVNIIAAQVQIFPTTTSVRSKLHLIINCAFIKILQTKKTVFKLSFQNIIPIVAVYIRARNPFHTVRNKFIWENEIQKCF